MATDEGGLFKAKNFFGYGRSQSGSYGITPGSICLKFYEPGYQSFGMSGIGANSESGLDASTTYYLKVSVDGSTATEINITTSSNNTMFGGKDGIIMKLQEALDSERLLSTSDLYKKHCSVSLANGNLVFTSGQSLSTSAISITAGTTGNGSSTFNLLSAAYGLFPALADMDGAVSASLPDDNIYDGINYTTSPNKSKLTYDNGNGKLVGGQASGTINYETGEINFRGPRKADFAVSALYNSPLSGRRRATDSVFANINSLVSIHANSVNQKMGAEIKVELS
jgi:hypothetical protein